MKIKHTVFEFSTHVPRLNHKQYKEYVYIQILLEGLHGIPALLFLDEAPLPLDFVLFLFDILIFLLRGFKVLHNSSLCFMHFIQF